MNIGNNLFEVCKEDGKMSSVFSKKANNENYKVYFVCEFSGMEILLEEPEYRNGVKYLVKTLSY